MEPIEKRARLASILLEQLRDQSDRASKDLDYNERYVSCHVDEDGRFSEQASSMDEELQKKLKGDIFVATQYVEILEKKCQSIRSMLNSLKPRDF